MVWLFDKDVESGANEYQELLGMAYLRNLRQHVVHRKFTYLAAFDGRHRSGKSLTACTMAYILDPSFWDNFDKRVVSTPTEFMNAVIDIRNKGIKGAVVVVDEAGVSMASSDWYERWNRVLGKAIQMFGFLYIQVFFCAPNKGFIDSKVRKMFHGYYRVERFTNDYSIVFPYTIKFSSMTDKWYYKHPVINYQGERIILTRIKFMAPPKFIMDRYNEFANRNKDQMLDDFMKEMKQQELTKTRNVVSLEEAIEKIIADPSNFLSKRAKIGEPILDVKKVRFFFKMMTSDAEYVKYEAENKLMEMSKSKQEVAIKETVKKEEEVKGRRKKLVARRLEDVLDGPVAVEQEQAEQPAEESEEKEGEEHAA